MHHLTSGGLLADALTSLLACLCTSPPNSTASQNCGVIGLTRCASRAAGIACAFWLVVLGVLGKAGGAFASIPICVVGGMVLMQFASLFVGGLRIAAMGLTRRNSFILSVALGVGLGVAMQPNVFEAGGGGAYYAQNLAFLYGFWPKKYTCNVFPTDAATGEPDLLCASAACCKHWDVGRASGRTALVTVLQTPYCIGFLLALALHLLLPYDRADEMDAQALDVEVRAKEEEEKRRQV